MVNHNNKQTTYLSQRFTITVLIATVKNTGRIHPFLHQRGAVLEEAAIRHLRVRRHILVVDLLGEADLALLQIAVAHVPLFLCQPESGFQVPPPPRLWVTVSGVTDGDPPETHEGIGCHRGLGLAQRQAAILECDGLEELPQHLGGEDAQLVLLVEIRLEDLFDVL